MLKTMKLNLALLAPDDVAPVFQEVLELAAHLQDLDHEVFISSNRLKPDYLNLIFGYQYLPSQSHENIAQNFPYLIVQLEQLSEQGGLV